MTEYEHRDKPTWSSERRSWCNGGYHGEGCTCGTNEPFNPLIHRERRARNEARIVTAYQQRKEELVWLHGLATDKRVRRRIERHLFRLATRP